MLVADGCRGRLLSSFSLLLLDVLLHVAIFGHARDDYRLIDTENPHTPIGKKKKSMLAQNMNIREMGNGRDVCPKKI